MKKKKLARGEKGKICETCGDYEYCAGNYGTDICSGYIQEMIYGIIKKVLLIENLFSIYIL